MAKEITAQAVLAKHVAKRDRVLLLNPPVDETRYSWVRWNQPLDLLKIGSYLRRQLGCHVELLDCMKPDAHGKVKEAWLPRDRRYHVVKDERYPMRRFGLPAKDLAKQLEAKAIAKKCPTQVWITSLCSYWHESVAEVCRLVRRTLPDAQIAILGQYARLTPGAASTNCAADFVVGQPADLEEEPVALDLYDREPPPFLALRLRKPEVILADVRAAV